MDMLKGPRAVKAGIVYLQDETYEFRTKENGKLWTVYGSPVCSSVFNHVHVLNLKLLLLLLVVSRILQLGIQLRTRERRRYLNDSSFAKRSLRYHPSLELVSKFPKTDILCDQPSPHLPMV